MAAAAGDAGMTQSVILGQDDDDNEDRGALVVRRATEVLPTASHEVLLQKAVIFVK